MTQNLFGVSLLILLAVGCLFYFILLVRVNGVYTNISDEGITHRSLFRTRRLKWEDVDSVTKGNRGEVVLISRDKTQSLQIREAVENYAKMIDLIMTKFQAKNADKPDLISGS